MRVICYGFPRLSNESIVCSAFSSRAVSLSDFAWGSKASTISNCADIEILARQSLLYKSSILCSDLATVSLRITEMGLIAEEGDESTEER